MHCVSIEQPSQLNCIVSIWTKWKWEWCAQRISNNWDCYSILSFYIVAKMPPINSQFSSFYQKKHMHKLTEWHENRSPSGIERLFWLSTYLFWMCGVKKQSEIREREREVTKRPREKTAYVHCSKSPADQKFQVCNGCR